MIQERWLDIATKAVEALVPVFGKADGLIYYDVKPSSEQQDKIYLREEAVSYPGHQEVVVCWPSLPSGALGHHLTLAGAGGPGDPVKYTEALRKLLIKRDLILPEEIV